MGTPHHAAPSRPAGREHHRVISGFTIVELLITLAVIGIIAAIGIAASMYAFDAARLGNSVAALRGTADAIMKYQTDTSLLPPGGLQPVSAIAPLLQPVSGKVPMLDGWGRDLYYEPYSSGGVPTFRLYCYGKDGVPDGAVLGLWVDFYTDTVMESTTFIQSKW